MVITAVYKSVNYHYNKITTSHIRGILARLTSEVSHILLYPHTRNNTPIHFKLYNNLVKCLALPYCDVSTCNISDWNIAILYLHCTGWFIIWCMFIMRINVDYRINLRNIMCACWEHYFHKSRITMWRLLKNIGHMLIAHSLWSFKDAIPSYFIMCPMTQSWKAKMSPPCLWYGTITIYLSIINPHSFASWKYLYVQILKVSCMMICIIK